VQERYTSDRTKQGEGRLQDDVPSSRLIVLARTILLYNDSFEERKTLGNLKLKNAIAKMRVS
jgi:hypothetical protein